MKRYLITITGRANLGYKGNRLRDRDLCYSYVYGKNKAEAISKFWEQIEKSSGLKGFERRDFKLSAERWEKDSFFDVNGNVVTDIEWAIPFDLLASVEMVHDEHFKNYKLVVPESIMAEAEKASEDAEPVAQPVDNRKPSEIIRSSWDWKGAKTQSFIINGKKITTNLCSEWGYYNGWDIPEKYTYRLGGKCYKSKHCSADELDELVAQGFDEIRFKLYASKMIRGYCETYVYASKSAVAKEKRAQLRAEAEAKKIEEAKAELSNNLSAQLKADAEKKAEREAQAHAEAIQRGAIINPEKNYHVVCWKIGAPVEEKTDCGIWKGDGMAHFSEGFGGFTYSADGWLYFAQEAQEEPEKDDDLDAHMVNTSKRIVITREKINEWNENLESSRGTSAYYKFTLWHEGRDEHGKWFDLGNRSGINSYHVDHPSDHYFIKKIKEITWIYFEDCAGIQDRWMLSDLAIEFFINNVPLNELAGSPEKEDEIIHPDSADATESNSEAQEGKNSWDVSVFFSKDMIMDELFRLKSDLGSGDVVGYTRRHEHQMNRYIKALAVAIALMDETADLSETAREKIRKEA